MGVQTNEYKKYSISKNELLQKIKEGEINNGTLMTTGKIYEKHKDAYTYIIKGIHAAYDKKHVKLLIVL